jgi:SAM-dependent methyltransferase
MIVRERRPTLVPPPGDPQDELMGWYRERVLPGIHNRVLDTEAIGRIRDRVCAPLHGRVVEIGFGSGLNVPHYPPAVTRVHAIEPSARARELARVRVAASAVPIGFDGLDGQRLPFDDATMDGALVTFTLCSVPDPVAAVRELRRVLVPGAVVTYVEHGASPDPDVRRWQQRLNPLNRRLSGCRLDTGVPAVLRDGGLHVGAGREYYLPGAARWAAYLYEGTARTPQ